MDGAISTADERKRKSSKVTLAVLVFVLALVIFGAAFYYAGGMELVQPLLGGGLVSPSGTGTPAASTPASASVNSLPAGVDTNMIKRMYVEQIESASNIERLAAGQFKSITIDKVVMRGDSDADVAITAELKDGTKAGGVIQVVKRGGNWYFFSITGLGNTGGLSASINTAQSMETSEALASEASEAGVKTFDEDVMATMASQQAANQEIVAGFVDGSVTKLVFGSPQAGAGTVSLPITASGPKSAAYEGSALLVTKTVDGVQRTFLTTFKKL
jgi:Domain of unknown function (DUF4878)